MTQGLLHIQEAFIEDRRIKAVGGVTPPPTISPTFKRGGEPTPPTMHLGLKLVQLTYQNFITMVFISMCLSYHNYIFLWLKKTDRWINLLNAMLWFLIALWPIVCIKSVAEGGFPSPAALVFMGVLLILINMVLTAMQWWGSKSAVNPAKRDTSFLLQTTLGSFSMFVVGVLFIIIGLVTMNMVVLDLSGFYDLTPAAVWIIGWTAYPGFWFICILTYIFWFGKKFRYVNDKVERGQDIRYKPIRLETFTDGVVAISVTILAIEFPAPLDINTDEYIRRMPDVASFGLIILLLMIHWYHHYRMVHWIKHVNLTLFWINSIFCFFMTMTPLAMKLLFVVDRYSAGGSNRSVADWYTCIILVMLGVTQIIQIIYTLRSPQLLHDHPIDGKLKRLMIFGAAATPIVAIFERLVSFSEWRGAWYLLFLSPVINIILFIVFGGANDSAHHGYHKSADPSLTYHFLAEPNAPKTSDAHKSTSSVPLRPLGNF